MKKTFIIILLFTSLCLWAQNVPQTIDYQGRLADSEGNYLNSVVTVEFLIYDAEFDGTLLWTEAQDVNCANGVFHVLLGSTVSFPTTLFDSADRWLELVVSSETLSPRTTIVSVPYSLKAEDAHSLNGLISTDFMPATTDNWVDTAGDTMTGQLIVQDFVGIGTPNPGRTLTVNSTGADPIQWQVNSSPVGQLGSNGSGAGGLYLYDNGPIAAKVTANGDSYFNGGNVGIGTDTPSAELEVNGNAIITGDLQVDGDLIIDLANLISNILPSGMIVPFAGDSGSIPEGWLLCDGSEVSRTEYDNLFNTISNNYGSGDNSTTFNLPDFRGRFLRGTDNGSGNDPNAGSRIASNSGGNSQDAVGSYQSTATSLPNNGFITDYTGNHSHDYYDIYLSSNGGTAYSNLAGSTSGVDYDNRGYQISRSTADSGNHSHTITGGDIESRPVNVYVNYIIKY